MDKKPLSEYIYDGILNDNVLTNQFNRLNCSYIKLILKGTSTQFDEGYESLLRYADLLSLSNNETYKNIAQQIVILSSQLFPKEPLVKILKDSVYRNVSNYANLELLKSKGGLEDLKYDFLRDLSFCTHREQNRAINSNSQNPIYLFDTQKNLLQEISNNQFFSFSAPTSMGKTFIILNYIKNEIVNGSKENFAIVVPTRALLNEIANKIINEFNELLQCHNYNVITTTETIRENNYIAVLTPERLYYSLITNKGREKQIEFSQIFIDEAHKISEKDKRSIIYYKILEMIKSRPNYRVYFSSPVIPNPDIYLELTNFYNEGSSNGRAYTFSPVIQNKIYLDFIDKKVRYLDAISRKIKNCDDVELKYQDDLEALIELGKGKCNLIYVSSAWKAVDYAKHLCERMKKTGVEPKDDKLEKAAKTVESSIHNDFYLAKFLRFGVAYHIGALPAQIRSMIEGLIKEKKIKYCFCTSTLLEGVNVPADNLFIMNHKKAYSALSVVDAYNLMGRAGRVTLNEFGNVFLLARKPDYKKYFDKVLSELPPKQNLLPQEALTNVHKKLIIDRLLQGKTNLLEADEKPKDKKFTEESYEYATVCLNILLHDICNQKESYIVKAFRKSCLTPQNIVDIRAIFNNIATKDDDVNISPLQRKSLFEKVRESNINYPQNFNYENCVNFLIELSKIFRWDIYEKSSLGKHDEYGNNNILRYYAVILLQWMQGKGIHEIIRSTLYYYESQGKSFMNRNISQQPIKYDKNSSLHKNSIINDVLIDIDQIINYKFSLYFLRFSEAVMKVRNLKSLPNDWYEYVEYGTNNMTVIQLQKYGLTREDAIQVIKENANFIFNSDEGEVRLNKEILLHTNDYLKIVLNSVAINFPELFI